MRKLASLFTLILFASLLTGCGTTQQSANKLGDDAQVPATQVETGVKGTVNSVKSTTSPDATVATPTTPTTPTTAGTNDQVQK